MSIAASPASTQERLATHVSEIMRPGVITIGDNASLLQAKRAMVRHGVHAVLVLATESGQPLGWVSAVADGPRRARHPPVMSAPIVVGLVLRDDDAAPLALGCAMHD